jgi:hypothetical protein
MFLLLFVYTSELVGFTCESYAKAYRVDGLQAYRVDGLQACHESWWKLARQT